MIRPFMLSLALLSAQAFAGGELQIPSSVPYAKPESIASNIREECQLPQAMAEALRRSLSDGGVSVKAVEPGAEAPAQGRALQVEILDAVSAGNAFIGHRKYVGLTVKLYEDGKLVDSFHPSRNSTGGAFGGFKGSCTVLVRCTDALGKDVAAWYAKHTAAATTE